jgi:NAD(P)-dependent dehydrogenase (short-subunit alcohol dehydrogenase family)
MSRLFSVEDKIVVITGGLGQLGLAYAGCLAGEAARVALLDLAPTPIRGGRDRAFFARGGPRRD